MKNFFPMVVDLTNRRCVVIGGGKVAERKVAALIQAEARITVISSEMSDKIRQWITDETVVGIHRGYVTGDAEGAFLTVAATDQSQVNYQVYMDVAEQNKLINVADRPELCSFVFPATVRRGKLLIAISTSGGSPLAASVIRKEMEANLADEYETYVDFLSEVRLKVHELVKDTKQRQQIYQKLIQADVLQAIRSGEFDKLKANVMERLFNEPLSFTIEHSES